MVTVISILNNLTMRKLTKLAPQPMFNYFEDICQIPRPSEKEDKIRKFLLEFARKNKLQAKSDKAGNVLISKPAVPGRENAPVVILQTHMDMVCEKNSDKVFDFDKDAIVPVISGEWIKADGTTLGADCGIGIAAQLALLASTEISHGPVECLMTVAEETGLTGAFNLQRGFMSGSLLINLDSEDEGEIFIGCAGGLGTVAKLKYKRSDVPENYTAIKLSITGLSGGHSGDDINKNRGNANKILNRLLWNISQEYDLRLSLFEGGNLSNAIPREANAIFGVPSSEKESIIKALDQLIKNIKNEYIFNEPDLKINIQKNRIPEKVIDQKTQKNLLNALYACPHGILEMSTRMEGMVETSSNLASVKFTGDDNIVITTSQRSEIESRKYYAAEMVRSVFELAGAETSHSDSYPGWTPNPGSGLLKIAVGSYKKLFDTEPVVRSIHAGLECGLFLEKYPDLDMISIGPTIKGAHSPDERLNIETVGKFWNHLKEILENIS
jgi:dipeptidase D